MKKLLKIDTYYIRYLSVIISMIAASLVFASHFLKCININTNAEIYYRASQVFFGEVVDGMNTLVPTQIGLIGFIFLGFTVALNLAVSFKKIGDVKDVTYSIQFLSAFVSALASVCILLIPSIVIKVNPEITSIYKCQLSSIILISVILGFLNTILICCGATLDLLKNRKKGAKTE